MKRALIRSHWDLDNQIKGGADNLILELAKALNSTGWQADILCPTSGPKSDNNSIKSFGYSEPVNAKWKIINSVRGISRVRSLLDSPGYDIVVDDISHIPHFPTHIFCPEDTVNAVFLHTAYFNSAREFMGQIKGSMLQFIDHSIPYLNDPEIVCAGPSTQDRFIKRTGHKKTHIIKPAIKVDEFNHNYNPSSKKILYLGRLVKRKNISTLLHAWNKFEQKNNDYELKIAGSGVMKNELLNIKCELGLSRVEFLGYISESEKRELLEKCFAFVLPSLMEGYATTGLEALASGCILLGANTFGIRDYITHKENGLLFDPNSAKELADLLFEISSKPDSYYPLTQNGLEVALEHTVRDFQQSVVKEFNDMVE
ncbi:glycosyltransferase family 4 protein [Halobellus clavatus]|uniref:Glycosyltransferase involved in cell wall bisynthesis n=1 Tax=Halobellus clavatus TaxID=660517 RepID=A0A1H3KYM5_9EURY|nr:glycosyltransferase family 4 protein [Halobellus clavatus]SDY57263.1 Glycosyltransferase involved in cell wall bisynthesis [Halobellus clavatus]